MLPYFLWKHFLRFKVSIIRMKRFISLLVLSLSIFSLTFAQNFYRISGEFSIKGKSENSAQLIMGKFFYDKNEKAIINVNVFPESATWVTSDTNLYKIVENKIVSRQTIPNFTPFSMYHMVLNNQLKNFGLEESIFKLDNVESADGLVISTWIPPKSLKKYYGKIMISSKDDKLFGIIFFNTDGTIIKKQFFEDYILSDGLAFPGKITEITYGEDGNESYQVTTYKNIVVNDHHDENNYHFSVSDYQ